MFELAACDAVLSCRDGFRLGERSSSSTEHCMFFLYTLVRLASENYCLVRCAGRDKTNTKTPYLSSRLTKVCQLSSLVPEPGDERV